MKPYPILMWWYCYYRCYRYFVNEAAVTGTPTYVRNRQFHLKERCDKCSGNGGVRSAMYPEMYSNFYQGDIIIFENADEHPDKQTRDPHELKNGLRAEIFRWPNATVPYVLGSNFTEDDKVRIVRAMNRLENETCVKFVPRSKERHYIYVDNRKGGGCHAVIGYHWNANKPHPVNLESPACLRHQGTIEHELLHIMGLFHEQSRADRDQHVTIFWGNITPEYKSNFEKMSDLQTATYNVPYDVNSVMHYPRFAFSKNGLETIVSKKDPEQKLGQRFGAAPSDLNKIRSMYRCSDTSANNYASVDWFMEQINKFFSENNN